MTDDTLAVAARAFTNATPQPQPPAQSVLVAQIAQQQTQIDEQQAQIDELRAQITNTDTDPTTEPTTDTTEETP